MHAPVIHMCACRGYVNVFLSRWQTAKDCFEDALTLDPSSKVIQSNITVCTFYMGRLKEVRACVRVCVCVCACVRVCVCVCVCGPLQ